MKLRFKTGRSTLKHNMVSGTTYGRSLIVLLSFITIITCGSASTIQPIEIGTLFSDDDTTIGTSTPTHYDQTTIIDRSIDITEPLHISSSTSSTSLKNQTIRNVLDHRSIDRSGKDFRKYLSPTTGNELWDGLIRDCMRRPTFSCFQKNVHQYLDQTLDMGDVNVTNTFMFIRNKVDPYKYTKEANDQTDDHHDRYDDDKENEIPDSDEGRSESPIEEVTDALYDKGINFMMTHDTEFQLPEVMFDGAIIRISPRSFEGNGALVKLELIPKEIRVKETGRIFFKKIKKFFKNKLLLSFLAIVLVIKLIKIKLVWLLPLIVGVAAAKKLLLKFLLFLFPALAHIFKLCSYYHKNYHETKFHHHQHHINHLHTVVPQWYEHGPPVHHGHGHGHGPIGQHSHGPELIYTNPPKGHPAEYLHGGSPPHQHLQPDWELSGPGLGSEYISDIHRNAQVNQFSPKIDDVNDINAWGLGATVSPSPSHSLSNNNPFVNEVASRILNQRPSPVYVQPTDVGPISRVSTASNIAAQYAPQDPQVLRETQHLQAQQQEAIRIQAEQKLIAHQQKILQQQPFVQDPSTQTLMDPFYSPILQKIDRIFLQLGVPDEPCRERLVCSMYKNPVRYSPHSNFISAELSRDTSELAKPLQTNPAVVRFYRYVQAARDGQEQNDCLRLYTQCSITTE